MNSIFTVGSASNSNKRQDGDVIFTLDRNGRHEEILRFTSDGEAQVHKNQTKDNLQILKAFKEWLGNSDKPIANVGESIVFQTPTKDWLTLKPNGEIWINGQFVKIDIPCLTNFKRFVYQVGYASVERSIYFKSGQGAASSQNVSGVRGGDITLTMIAECNCASLLHGHHANCHFG